MTKKLLTVAEVGQLEYEVDEIMHNVKSVKIANKEVPFKVLIVIDKAPKKTYEMVVELKTLEISIKQK
jgi:hypothetical protein